MIYSSPYSLSSYQILETSKFQDNDPNNQIFHNVCHENLEGILNNIIETEEKEEAIHMIVEFFVRHSYHNENNVWGNCWLHQRYI